MRPSSGKFDLLPLPLEALALTTMLVCSALLVRALRETRPSAVAGAGQGVSAPATIPGHFMKTWCFDCHGDGAKKGGLALDDPASLSPQAWENVRRHVLLQTMPPQGKPSPANAERDLFETALLRWQASLPEARSTGVPPVSSPLLRRLSRSEGVHSLQALLGVDADTLLTDLPEDETAHGFDNNGDMQPLPPARLESYLAAFSGAANSALLPAPIPPKAMRVMAPEFQGDGGLFPDAPIFHLSISGAEVRVKYHAPAAGRYRWSLIAYAHQAGDGPVLVQLADSPPQPVWAHDRDHPELLSVTLDLPAGDGVLTYRLSNPLADPDNPDPHRRARRLLVRESSLDGPLEGGNTPGPRFSTLLGPLPTAQAGMEEKLRLADAALTPFARRAWRRPVTTAESLRLLSLTGNSLANGLRYDEAMAGTVKAILVSPGFLFLSDPAHCPADQKAWAVASRLSFFLWSAPPDEALLSACARGLTPAALEEAARRLLDDERAQAFANDFAGQWLQLRNATLASPDKTLFPQATPEIRAAMREESTRFFLSLIRENAPVLSLLDADHTFLNAAMAEFYGLPRPAGSKEFERVVLPSPVRRGLLNQASVLMLTSYPNRTSPVLRGKYILDTLLGLEPPPPPPNVPTLNPADDPHSPGGGGGPHSIRAALERHRADPGCASCHRAIDPLGFPLEAWNAIGRPAAAPGEGGAITAPATVFTGETLASPADLTNWLIHEQGPRIVRHTAERLLTYALGRGLTPAETWSARQLADEVGGRDARFRDLILAVVRSDAFRGEKP